MDDSNMIYCVDHMYNPNAWGAYCSEVSPNVNTLAFLKVRSEGGEMGGWSSTGGEEREEGRRG